MDNLVSYNTFYASWHDAMAELNNEQYGRLSRALNEYCFFGIVPELTGIEKTIFKMAIPNINASNRLKINGKKGAKTRAELAPLSSPLVKPAELAPLSSNGEGEGEGEGEGNEEEKRNVDEAAENWVSFSDFDNPFQEPVQENPDPPHIPPDPLPDKPSQTREDAGTVFNKARKLWNELNIPPQCREIVPKNAAISDCMGTFQHYSWLEIENAIKNYKYHITNCNNDWKPPPNYGSIYGFLKTGVARYFDNKAFEQQFKIKEVEKVKKQVYMPDISETEKLFEELEKNRQEADFSKSFSEGFANILRRQV